jgi:hypothetical protein
MGNSNGEDLVFTDDMLKRVENDLCNDTTRIFSDGFSYGVSPAAQQASRVSPLPGSAGAVCAAPTGTSRAARCGRAGGDQRPGRVSIDAGAPQLVGDEIPNHKRVSLARTIQALGVVTLRRDRFVTSGRSKTLTIASPKVLVTLPSGLGARPEFFWAGHQAKDIAAL